MEFSENVEKRLTNVEIALTHLQTDYEALNETILLMAKQIELLQAGVERLASRIDESESTAESRDPEDEKPPHY